MGEIVQPKHANIICGVIYRQHNSPERFQLYFEEIIEKLSASGRPIYVMGDFNINLLRCGTCKFAQDFLLTLQSFNLTPIIDKPTRVYKDSATLIDNIFSNHVDGSIVGGNIVSDLSDHFSQFCITCSDMSVNNNHHQSKLSRDYSNFSKTKFNNELSRLDLSAIISRTNDLNKSFSTFFNKLQKLIDKHDPLKPLSKLKIN